MQSFSYLLKFLTKKSKEKDKKISKTKTVYKYFFLILQRDLYFYKNMFNMFI